jgi:hypothetical protein
LSAATGKAAIATCWIAPASMEFSGIILTEISLPEKAKSYSV